MTKNRRRNESHLRLSAFQIEKNDHRYFFASRSKRSPSRAAGRKRSRHPFENEGAGLALTCRNTCSTTLDSGIPCRRAYSFAFRRTSPSILSVSLVFTVSDLHHRVFA